MDSPQTSKAIRFTARLLDITWYFTIAFSLFIILLLIFKPAIRPASWIMAGVVIDSTSTPYSIISEATGLPLDSHGVESEISVMKTYGYAMIKSPSTLWSVLFNIKESIAQLWVFAGLYLLRRVFRSLKNGAASPAVLAAMFRQVGVLTIFFELMDAALLFFLQVWLSKNVTTTGLRIDLEIFPELPIIVVGLLLLVIAEILERKGQSTEVRTVPEIVANDPTLTN